MPFKRREIKNASQKNTLIFIHIILFHRAVERKWKCVQKILTNDSETISYLVEEKSAKKILEALELPNNKGE